VSEVVARLFTTGRKWLAAIAYLRWKWILKGGTEKKKTPGEFAEGHGVRRCIVDGCRKVSKCGKGERGIKKLAMITFGKRELIRSTRTTRKNGKRKKSKE